MTKDEKAEIQKAVKIVQESMHIIYEGFHDDEANAFSLVLLAAQTLIDTQLTTGEFQREVKIK